MCSLLRAKGFTCIPSVGHILVPLPRFDRESVMTFQGHSSVRGKIGARFEISLFQAPREKREGEGEGERAVDENEGGWGSLPHPRRFRPLALSFARLSRSLEQANLKSTLLSTKACVLGSELLRAIVAPEGPHIILLDICRGR